MRSVTWIVLASGLGVGALACVYDQPDDVAPAAATHSALRVRAVRLAALRDTFIIGTTDPTRPEPHDNYGTAAELRVSTTVTSNKVRSLVGFDVDAIRDTVGTGTVRSARIRFVVSGTWPTWGGRTVRAYRLVEPWTEDGATWWCPHDSNLFNNSPDCDAAAIARWKIEEVETVLGPATGTTAYTGQSEVVLPVTADVAAIAAGTDLTGWLLVADNETGAVDVRFKSRETGIPPILEIEVESPDVPSSGGTFEDCDNGHDDDEDGSFDCADDSCADASFCATPPTLPTPPALNQTVATSLLDSVGFIYGVGGVQVGVETGAIPPRTALAFRGRVLDEAGSPLSNVTVRIARHEEFGVTRTRTDGRYDFVAAGDRLTVVFEKLGYAPVERHVEAHWGQWHELDDVVLLAYSIHAEYVDLGGIAATAAFELEEETDLDGTRHPVLMFEPGTTAEMVLANGSTQPIDDLVLRATEYTVGAFGPQAMPAELPPNSAYTYCVEFSADEAIAAGATRVELSQPAVFYLENFNDADVGLAIPLGSYDRTRSMWDPAADGRVIEVVAITGGLADLDVTGDGVADTGTALSDLGITTGERARVAELYLPGQELWRLRLRHFSAHDANHQMMVPAGAEPPAPPAVADRGLSNPCSESGSVIECENQTLGEAIPVTGTGDALYYSSDRVLGRRDRFRVDVQVTGPSYPAFLEAASAELHVAGRKYVFEVTTPAANITHTFEWDGLDAFGRRPQGAQLAKLIVAYNYCIVPAGTPASSDPSARRFGTAVAKGTLGATGCERTVLLGGMPACMMVGLSTAVEFPLGVWDARADIGGLSLGRHHHFQAGELILGTGQTIRPLRNDTLIGTYAGNGTNGNTGDGGPATSAAIGWPAAVAIGPDGSVYVGSRSPARVRRVAPDGTISLFAGGGSCFPGIGDGGPATSACIADVFGGLAVGPDGSVYIGEFTHDRIRRVDPDGIITTFAGTGVGGNSGDEGPATSAQIQDAQAVAVGPDGSVYICDSQNFRVRVVTPDGYIHPFAGGGSNYSIYRAAAEGAHASDVYLYGCGALATTREGQVYVADGNGAIYRIERDSRVHYVAGASCSDPYGDPTTPANTCNSPRGLAVDPAGGLLIADYGHNRILYVTPDEEEIHVLAGSKDGGFWGVGFRGDGGLATAGGLYGPEDIALTPDGRDLYIADGGNNRVRRVRGWLGNRLDQAAIASPDGGEVFIFDAAGRHLRTLEAVTGEELLTFGYDAAGRLSTITDAFTNVVTIERAGSGAPQAIVGPFGHRTELTLNADGYVEAIADPLSRTTELGYVDAAGLLDTMTTPRGFVHSFDWNADGRLIRDEAPPAQGGAKDLDQAESGASATVTVTTAGGRETLYTHGWLQNGAFERTVEDEATDLLVRSVRQIDGRIVTTFPDGTVSEVVERADPRLGYDGRFVSEAIRRTPAKRTLTRARTRSVTLADPLDAFSITTWTDTLTENGAAAGTRSYNGTTRTWTATSPLGREVETVTDEFGRPTELRVNGFEPIRLAYDGRGRTQRVESGPTGSVRSTTYSYHATSGWLQHLDTTITSMRTDRTTLTHSAVLDVTNVVRPDLEEIGFGYDASHNLTSLTPPDRSAHAFVYQSTDLATTYTPPVVGGSTTWDHDLDERLEQVTLGDGRTIGLEYFTSGALTADRLERIVTALGNIDPVYSSTNGQLQSVSAPGSVTTSYTWDGPLPLTETTNGPYTATVAYDYDSRLRLSTLTVAGVATSYGYDADSLLTSAGALTITRDPDNGVVTGTSAGSVTTSQTFTPFAELATLDANYGGSSLYAVDFTEHDHLGRIIERVESVLGGTASTYRYAYDLAGRLTEVRKDGVVVEEYTYDAQGNRLNATAPGLSQSCSYDGADRLVSCGTTTFTYNNAGQLATKTDGSGTTTYTYDALGNLRTVQLPSGDVIDYIIDGEGRRVGRKLNGVFTGGWLWANDTIVAEIDASAAVLTRFVWASNSLAPELMVRGSTTYRIVSDERGSVRLVVDMNTGTVAQRIDYDSWGRVLADSNPGWQPLAFAGGLWDGPTGLVRLGRRDYDTMTGRWTSIDSVLFAGGDANLHAYCGADPVNHVDPDGTLAVWFIVWLLSLPSDRAGDPNGETSAAILGMCLFGDAKDAFGAGESKWLNRGPTMGPTSRPQRRPRNAGSAENPRAYLPDGVRPLWNEDAVFGHLEKHHGIDRWLSRNRLHEIKQAHGFGPADDVIFDWTGNVYDPANRGFLGSLTAGGAARGRPR